MAKVFKYNNLIGLVQVFYDPSVDLKLLELVCGFIIIGAALKQLRDLKNVHLSQLMVFCAGLLIVLRGFSGLSGFSLVREEFFNATVYLLFALSLSLGSRKILPDMRVS